MFFRLHVPVEPFLKAVCLFVFINIICVKVFRHLSVWLKLVELNTQRFCSTKLSQMAVNHSKAKVRALMSIFILTYSEIDFLE